MLRRRPGWHARTAVRPGEICTIVRLQVAVVARTVDEFLAADGALRWGGRTAVRGACEDGRAHRAGLALAAPAPAPTEYFLSFSCIRTCVLSVSFLSKCLWQ